MVSAALRKWGVERAVLIRFIIKIIITLLALDKGRTPSGISRRAMHNCRQ